MVPAFDQYGSFRKSWFFSWVVSPQLYFVYWDMSRCLRTLTDTLEERSGVANGLQVRDYSLCSPPPPLSSFIRHHFHRTNWGRKWLILSWWAKQRLRQGWLSRTWSRGRRSTGPCWGLRGSPAAAGQPSWRSSAPATASSPMHHFLLRWGGLLDYQSGICIQRKNCLGKCLMWLSHCLDFKSVFSTLLKAFIK